MQRFTFLRRHWSLKKEQVLVHRFIKSPEANWMLKRNQESCQYTGVRVNLLTAGFVRVFKGTPELSPHFPKSLIQAADFN